MHHVYGAITLAGVVVLVLAFLVTAAKIAALSVREGQSDR
jgi:hypothetical protein